ncbi:MAG: LuxR family transcriptional regulator [Oscillospiraceae bacterium]|nr:LuxR family transcriptional regulator [Oscillospiraceae bacterium]
MIPYITPAKKQGDGTNRDRRLTVIVFSLFFSWLLAVPFEGQVLYAVADYHGVSPQFFVFGSMAVHIAGLIMCSIFVRNMRTAKKLILFSIAFCAAATGVLFLAPSHLWTAALLIASFLVGVCVAAWGFYFKEYTPKDERIKTMADGLIFSNLIMILLNMAAIHISPQTGLGFSLLVLAAAFVFALRLPQTEIPQEPKKQQSDEKSDALKKNKIAALAFLCMFIMVITITSGLMYQVVNPAFAHLKLLTSWYWAVPYIVALFIMRSLPKHMNRAYILYIAIAMIGFSFIIFLFMGRLWSDYLIVNTLMLGACGIYDLFWWSILGEMLEYDNNPAKIFGVGLAANVSGVLAGGLIGNAIFTEQNYTLLAFGVVFVTLVMLPPLNNRLTKLLNRHVFLTAFPKTPDTEEPTKGQPQILNELKLVERLTEREHEVMRLMIAGKTNKEIADDLCIAVTTVKYHAGNIYGKTGTENRVELTNLVLKKPDPPAEM